MAGGVSEYAAVCARVRVKYSTLLDAATLGALAGSADLDALVEGLKHTPYASVIADLSEPGRTSDYIGALRRRQAAEARSVIGASPRGGKRVLREFFRSHEVNNLKAVLRGIAAGQTPGPESSRWKRVRDLLFPLADATVVPSERMMEAGTIPAAIELLRGTPYFEVLSYAVKRYSTEQSLFALEVALDLDHWRQLWFEARRLSGEDQSQAMRVIGSLVDALNVMWAIRYRVYQHLSEEELINYTLPFGRRVRDEDIRAIAAGADVGSVVARLFPEIADVNSLLAEPRKGLPRLEIELKRIVARRCAAAFLGNPFHVGLPLAYLALHDLEIQDLIVLLEAKSTQLGSAEFMPFVVASAAVPA